MKEKLLIKLYLIFILVIAWNFPHAQSVQIEPELKNETNFSISGISPYITPALSYQTVFCPNVTSLTMKANPTNAGYHYQWSTSSTENGIYTDIPGAINSTYTSTITGFFKVAIDEDYQDLLPPVISQSYQIRTGAMMTFSATNNTNTTTIFEGDSASFKANFTGTGPFAFYLNGNSGEFTKTLILPNNSNIFKLKSESNKLYQILGSIYDSRGIGCSTNSFVTVKVNPPPILALPTPPVLNVCPGNIIEIPVSYSGAWGPFEKVKMRGLLKHHKNGGYNCSISGFSAEQTIKYLIPKTMPLDTFNFELGGQFPETISVLSQYKINVVNTGCTDDKTIIFGTPERCGNSLTAFPNIYIRPSETGYTYKWFKNNVLISDATNYNYFPFSSGNYTVQVMNSNTGYNAFSEPYTVNYYNKNNFNLTVSNPNLCNGSSTITSTLTGLGYEYRWFKEGTQYDLNTRIPISVTTNPFYITFIPGNYFCLVWDGKCEWISQRIIVYECLSISCSPDILVPVSFSTLFKVIQYAAPNSTGNTITQLGGLPSGGNFPFGTTINTFKATSSNSNSNTCSFKVILYDESAPLVTGAIIPNAVPDANTGNYSISSALFLITIPSGITVTGLLIPNYPPGVESITINGITYGPPITGARINSNKADLVPFPTNGVIAITDNLGKPIDPIIVNPLPNENQINVDYLAINSNNIQSPITATLTINFGSASLPLSLLSFSAKPQENQIQLNWKTTNETNFSHFEIQKSDNGKEFGTAGNVNGNESGFYNFIDSSPNQGLNYYKLRMIDFDGTSTFSKTIFVNFERNGYYLSVENPTKNGELLVRSNYLNPSFTLLNSLGQKIEISVSEMVDNQHKIMSKTSINGIYFLMVESEGKVVTRKVLIE